MSLESVNQGPLTTVFTPPSTCSDVRVMIAGVGTFFVFDPAVTCVPNTNQASWVPATQCYPPSTSVRMPVDLTYSINPIPVYSPGHNCPHGFTTACTVSRERHGGPPVVPGSEELWSMIKPGETLFGCCASGYHCTQSYDIYPYCESTPKAGDTISGVLFDDKCGRTPTVIGPIRSGIGVANAQRVNLVRGEPITAARTTATKRSHYRSSSATSAFATRTAATKGPYQQSSRTRKSTESGKGEASGLGESSNGLSTGVKVAIGLAVPAGILFISVIVFFFVRRRWNDKVAKHPQDGTLGSAGKPELEGDLGKTFGREAYQKAELQSNDPAVELHADDRPFELQSGDRAFELHSDERAFELPADDRIFEVRSTNRASEHHSNDYEPEPSVFLGKVSSSRGRRGGEGMHVLGRSRAI